MALFCCLFSKEALVLICVSKVKRVMRCILSTCGYDFKTVVQNAENKKVASLKDAKMVIKIDDFF